MSRTKPVNTDQILSEVESQRLLIDKLQKANRNDLVPLDVVMKAAGVTRSVIYRRMSSGVLPAGEKVFNSLRWKIGDVLSFLEVEGLLLPQAKQTDWLAIDTLQPKEGQAFIAVGQHPDNNDNEVFIAINVGGCYFGLSNQLEQEGTFKGFPVSVLVQVTFWKPIDDYVPIELRSSQKTLENSSELEKCNADLTQAQGNCSPPPRS